jgi:hypothetical protein
VNWFWGRVFYLDRDPPLTDEAVHWIIKGKTLSQVDACLQFFLFMRKLDRREVSNSDSWQHSF